MDAAGDFVIVWSSNPQNGSGWNVLGQRFDSSGKAVGGEFRSPPISQAIRRTRWSPWTAAATS